MPATAVGVDAVDRAWCGWQRMLDDGVYTSVSEIGDAENISKSYVSRILRLALLAPGIPLWSFLATLMAKPLELAQLVLNGLATTTQPIESTALRSRRLSFPH
jgi:hypothetical protein